MNHNICCVCKNGPEQAEWTGGKHMDDMSYSAKRSMGLCVLFKIGLTPLILPRYAEIFSNKRS